MFMYIYSLVFMLQSLPPNTPKALPSMACFHSATDPAPYQLHAENVHDAHGVWIPAPLPRSCRV